VLVVEVVGWWEEGGKGEAELPSLLPNQYFYYHFSWIRKYKVGKGEERRSSSPLPNLY